jgi:hypothetical protein
LHLLAGRALAEHLAEVPIQLPEGLARGRHLARASALPHSLSPTLCAGSSAKIAEGLLFPGASRRRNGTRRDL